MCDNTINLDPSTVGTTDTAVSPFIDMLPRVQRHAGRAFRHLPIEAREEAVQETVANAFVAYTRLAERGREHVAFAAPLTRYAIKQVCVGRRVGTSINSRDLMASPTREDRPRRVLNGTCPDQWQTLLAFGPGRNCDTPAEQAAFRIDFANWLRTLPARDRRLALLLARGERAGRVARCLGVTPARVTQIRQGLCQRWQQFHGEATTGLA